MAASIVESVKKEPLTRYGNKENNMILDRFKLDKKVAIVTGSTRGIGAAIAKAFAEAGADIVGVGRSDHSEVKEYIESIGRRYYALTIDIGNPDAPDRIVNEAVKKYGRIDIVVNNAGTTARNMAIDFTEEQWDRVLNINLKSAFFICQRAARQFIDQGGSGQIINIASLTSYQGGIKVISYTASKAALKNITMQMSNEWSRYGIRINGIAPGYTVTELTGPMRTEEERVAETMTRIPMQRWAEPDDMAGAAVFLASDASSYINGFTIVVDGGYLGR